jgi:hypothetical protein
MLGQVKHADNKEIHVEGYIR